MVSDNNKHSDAGTPVDSVVSIGNFDGVHLGHQKILSDARKIADAAGAIVSAVTLHPHPIAIIAPEKAPPVIMTPDQKHAALRAAGADLVIMVETTKELINLTAEDFLRYISDKIHPVAFVEGDDFYFGRNRSGDTDMLRRMGSELDFEVRISKAVTIDLPDGENMRISSTAIRRLLLGGDVKNAAMCMGRNFELSGKVVRGRGEGRKLGYPTANLDCADQLIPADGIYAALASLPDGRKLPAAMFIGSCVTYDQTNRVIEAHIPVQALADGEKLDLYGKEMQVQLVEHLRFSKKFPTLDELKEAIKHDIENTMRIVTPITGR